MYRFICPSSAANLQMELHSEHIQVARSAASRAWVTYKKRTGGELGSKMLLYALPAPQNLIKVRNVHRQENCDLRDRLRRICFESKGSH